MSKFVVFVAYVLVASNVFAAKSADVLADLKGMPNLSAVTQDVQTNITYRICWENPKEEMRFAKIVFPLPRMNIESNSQYYYEFELTKLVGEIAGMTLGRHAYALNDGKPCFAGRYYRPVKGVGVHLIPMSVHPDSDATVLDRIVLSSNSKRFEAEFLLKLHKGNPAVVQPPNGLDFFRVYGWMIVVGILISLVIKWRTPVKVDTTQTFTVGRYGSLDVLKGLGCIAVVLIHYNFPGWTGKAVWASSRFAVPLFFCISGFFLVNSKGCITVRALVRKAWRLIVLLTAVIIVYHVYLKFVPEFAPRLRADKMFGLTASFWLNNSLFPVIWFVGALVYSYVFMILFCGPINRIALWTLASVLWLGCFYLYDVNAIWPMTAPSTVIKSLSGSIVWSNFFLFRALPFVLMGLLLRLHLQSVEKWICSPVVTFCLVLIGFAVSVGEMTQTGRVQFSIGCVFAMIAMFSWAIGNPNGGARWLRLVGERYSLLVYLSHIPIGTLVRKLATGCEIDTEMWFKWSLPLMVLALSIGFAFAVDSIKRIVLRRK